MRFALLLLAVLASSIGVAAQSRGDDLDRLISAHRVVSGTVVDVSPTFAVNEYGDQLIVSDVVVEVEETLKGRDDRYVTVRVEGGTLGDLTLTVSDMPDVRRGERVVVFIDAGASGNLVLRDRGNGYMRLEASGRVRGSSLTLDDIRSRLARRR